jgi:hypothetical protein
VISLCILVNNPVHLQQVLVKIVSSSVNPVDVQIRSGVILERWGFTVKYPKASADGLDLLVKCLAVCLHALSPGHDWLLMAATNRGTTSEVSCSLKQCASLQQPRWQQLT